MKINLNKLELTNFKVVRSKSINFQDKTNIYAANGVGKTTLKDAFLWLLFGKDSTNRKDFSIKTLDEHNEPFHNLDHEVTATLDVNGEEIVIKRSMREKWTKKKGTAVTEFTGHETFFSWNDVPCQLGEYQKKVDRLVNEELFRLITSTAYFPALSWQDRRKTLLDIAGSITNEEIFSLLSTDKSVGNLKALRDAISKNKSPEDLKKEIAAKIKTIKNELDLIPSRIEENNRSLPDAVDYDQTEKVKGKAEKDLAQVEDDLLDKTRSAQQRQNEKTAKIQQRGTLEQDKQTVVFRIQNLVKDRQRNREQNIQDLRRDLFSKQTELSTLNTTLSGDENKKSQLLDKQATLRSNWAAKNAEVFTGDPEPIFNEADNACPTCKRAFDTAIIEGKHTTMLNNFRESQKQKEEQFNTQKANSLTDISNHGGQVGTEISALEITLGNHRSKLTALESDLVVINNKISDAVEEHNRLMGDEEKEVLDAINLDAEYVEITEKIQQLSVEIDSPDVAEDNSELQSKKQILIREIDSYKNLLATKEQREKIERRIQDLKTQEKTQAQEIANLQGIEFSIEKFNKARMDELEKRINNRFEVVRFKMFREQINGGEEECCEILIDGVPYSDANTASKINAGLDIINTLSKHYDVSAPIFVDNRESVVDLIETDAQLINLIVSKPDKTMRIEYEQAAEAVA